MSDPEEYRDHGISVAMGETYFSTLGGGDPYATGMAYPVWLGLVAMFPSELGGDVAGFADALRHARRILRAASCPWAST